MEKIIYLFILLIPFSIKGQEEGFEKVNMVRASGTFGMGSLLESGTTTLLIPTSLEYYIAENISVRADAVWFLGYSDPVFMGFSNNHSVLVGASYHFTKNKQFDPYVGIQPGMAFTQYGIIDRNEPLPDDFAPFSDENIWLFQNEKSSLTMNSIFSPHVGFNYYAKNFFHLFFAARYIHGSHHSEIPVKSLNEIRFEFGLGLDLRLDKYINKKPKLQ